MSIPSNLLPTSLTTQANSSINVTSDVVEELSSAARQRLNLLNTAIPDSLFTGSVESIRNRALTAAKLYADGITIPNIPTIPSFIPDIPIIPSVPSYGEIKDYIESRIDAITAKRIKAFEEAQEVLVKEAESPYTLKRTALSRLQTSQVINNRF